MLDKELGEAEAGKKLESRIGNVFLDATMDYANKTIVCGLRELYKVLTAVS